MLYSREKKIILKRKSTGKMFSIMIPTRYPQSLSRDFFSLPLLMNTLTHVPNRYV